MTLRMPVPWHPEGLSHPSANLVTIGPRDVHREGRHSVSAPEYSFVSVPLRRDRAGWEFAFDYQTVITERAADGWGFVQLILLEHHTEPRADLVFVRKGQEQ